MVTDMTGLSTPFSGKDNEQEAGFIVWRDGQSVPASLKNSIIAIGNFDGLHLGHRALIETASQKAKDMNRPVAVLTFEPHPYQYFNKKPQFFRLTPENVKLSILAHLKLNGVFVKIFNRELAEMSADDFLNWLFHDLCASGLVIGHDFHFGAGREGTPDMLRTYCEQHNIPLIQLPPVTLDGLTASSSVIRKALYEGDIKQANRFLGYRWFIRSEVEHGEKRGRKLGFPTANMKLDDTCPLKYGVYAVRASLGRQKIDGIASFGKRPTFDDGAPRLETFLFDFSGNLYGMSMDIEFVSFIREEKKFLNLEALISAMSHDCEQARADLKKDTTPSMFTL